MGPKRIRCDFLEPFYSGFWFLGLIFFPGIFEVYILRVYIYTYVFAGGGSLSQKQIQDHCEKGHRYLVGGQIVLL
jgi:hypothetical protein